ncbi:MAG: DUF805 domain-containing protein [Hyphomicrobiales bacterium]|nr:DUF805 domain-containing protein [Hyphomicrobiales bacterium]
MDRPTYRRAMGVLAFICGLVQIAPLPPAASGALYILELALSAAWNARRLHDTGRSAFALATSCVAFTALLAGLASSGPLFGDVLRNWTAETFGEVLSQSLVFGAVMLGSMSGMGLLSLWLWFPQSSAEGAAFERTADYAGTEDKADFGNADEAIARALAAQAKMRAAVAAPPSAPPAGKPPVRFGKRDAA